MRGRPLGRAEQKGGEVKIDPDSEYPEPICACVNEATAFLPLLPPGTQTGGNFVGQGDIPANKEPRRPRATARQRD